MLLNIVLFAAEASKSSPTVEILKVFIPAIIGAMAAWGGIVLQRKYSSDDKKETQKIDAYKVDLEQNAKQREFIIKENEELWKALKEELDIVKEEKKKLDAQVAIMRDRVLKIEADLAAWELGLKTPKGFRLVRIENDNP